VGRREKRRGGGRGKDRMGEKEINGRRRRKVEGKREGRGVRRRNGGRKGGERR
jgi:hypothetical protein